MPTDLAAMVRPAAGLPAPGSVARRAFWAMVVGSGRELASLVEELLREAGLPDVRLVMVTSPGQALEHLAQARPAIIFLEIGAPDIASLGALVRLQAAAPGVTVVPVPTPPGAMAGQGWALRPTQAFDRDEVVGLLQQLALLDEGARRLFYLATHDRLTGLANRWLLEERLRHAIARSRRSGLPGALLFIDLDDFKVINDRHGHGFGDRMLVLAGKRLAQAVRASDTVARWGGDEFAVVLEAIQHREVAQGKGRQLAELLAEPAGTAGTPCTLRASVGVALFPDDGADLASLLAQADRRMYRAKGHGVLRCVFRHRRALRKRQDMR
jgi:diguanylate cyclase (GGDEF)-like protein